MPATIYGGGGGCGALSLGIKRPRCEADRLPPSSAEVKNVWSYTSTPLIRLEGVVLNYVLNASSWCGT
jgi:hypothetical protein